MNRKIRVALSSFVILSIVSLAVLVIIYYRAGKEPKAAFEQDERVEVKVEKVRYSGTKAGRVEWELEADSARRSKGEDLTILENVLVTFYAKDGAAWTLSSREASFREAAGEIDATGDVVIKSSGEGYTINTERLTFLLKDKLIKTEERVRMTSRGADLEGTGMRARVDQKSFRLLKDVRAVFKDSAI